MKDIEDIAKQMEIVSVYGVNEEERNFLWTYKDKLMTLGKRLEKRGRACMSIKNPIFRNKKSPTISADNMIILGLIILTSLLVYFLVPSDTWADASHVVKNPILVRVFWSALIGMASGLVGLFILSFLQVNYRALWSLENFRHSADLSVEMRRKAMTLKAGCTENAVKAFLATFLEDIKYEELLVDVRHQSLVVNYDFRGKESIMDFEGFEISASFMV